MIILGVDRVKQFMRRWSISVLPQYRTDEQTTYCGITALCAASRGKTSQYLMKLWHLEALEQLIWCVQQWVNVSVSRVVNGDRSINSIQLMIQAMEHSTLSAVICAWWVIAETTYRPSTAPQLYRPIAVCSWSAEIAISKERFGTNWRITSPATV